MIKIIDKSKVNSGVLYFVYMVLDICDIFLPATGVAS